MKRSERKELNKLCVKIRKCDKYKLWRQKVLERDLRLIKKGINLSNLQVHHKTPFRDIILRNNIKSVKDAEKCREFWIVKNGATITRGEHRIISLIERCKNNTLGFYEAINDWLTERLLKESTL